jgi:hypothetical protein
VITYQSSRESRCQGVSVDIFMNGASVLIVSDMDKSARLHSTFRNKVFGNNMYFVEYTYYLAPTLDNIDSEISVETYMYVSPSVMYA